MNTTPFILVIQGPFCDEETIDALREAIKNAYVEAFYAKDDDGGEAAQLATIALGDLSLGIVFVGQPQLNVEATRMLNPATPIAVLDEGYETDCVSSIIIATDPFRAIARIFDERAAMRQVGEMLPDLNPSRSVRRRTVAA